MLRYSILRILIFLACLIAFWLLGLRGETNLPYLVVAAALVSMVLSYFLLKPMRDQFSDQVAHKVEERVQTGKERHASRPRRTDSDEAAEDAEVGGDVDDTFR